MPAPQKDAPEFEGFDPNLFQYLLELTANNNREWFKAKQARYEGLIREPARAFVRAMGGRLEAAEAHLTADDRKVGGSLMRPQRDTRFSADKTPYKTNVGVQFRHEAGKDVHAPGLYLHISLEDCFMAIGMWRPERGALNDIRAHIAEHPDRWRAIVEDPAFTARFERGGESLKRPPKGYDKDHPLIEDLKRKDHILSQPLDPELLSSPALVDELMAVFEAGRAYCAFLCEAQGLPF